MESFDGWTPVASEQHDDLVAAPLRRLAALFDHDGAHWPAGELPPLAHWLYFLPEAAQSTIGADGHPARGAMLPPIDAPRRMWAGGRLTFHAPLPIGARATRRSIVTDVRVKDGRSGRLTFVTVRHEILVDGAAAIVEEQDLVFRGDGSGTPPAAPPDPRVATIRQPFAPDATALFRFSALTFNAHRIHYDRDYAVAQEHYPDLVVHGPYQAMLLAGHLLRAMPGRRMAHFSFRGARPLFVGRPAALNLVGEGPVALWTTDQDGCACMEAEATLA
ncbi:FAS1-like dehydratase domain-containing protein [Sphingomonas radiodurans]|uniref:FAS1-like dehydratase domain-containing protein n=1 Tax=Sphingomonas radiodurans TaxID=2890321 RepID=UPI001E35CBB7|nr:MaoC family dehydratase N-terminal domain-containing protein [Sphingomonas radiodurans]WBH17379.1 MaoC family dehydratase N-terminal domain-containing protein [Sphingomonas radiodurans]